MYVFVSWAYRDVATKADNSRLEWVHGLQGDSDQFTAIPAPLITEPLGEPIDDLDAVSAPDQPPSLADRLTTEFCLPEYSAVLKQQTGKRIAMDDVNANLLAVRFVIPQMERVVTYQLAKRMPGSGKLPVSLACRSLLLNTFKGEWTGDLTNPGTERLVLVGMKGIKNFLKDLAIACAALGEPLPIDLWQRQKCVAMPEESKLRQLVDACAYNKQEESEQQKYQNLILGWMGIGASAERDSNILLSTGFRMGLKGA